MSASVIFCDRSAGVGSGTRSGVGCSSVAGIGAGGESSASTTAAEQVKLLSADVQRTLAQLAEQGLVPESWGGDTIVIDVAPPAGIGVDELLESILLVADLYDPPLGADPDVPARAFVLESNLDIGRGPVATVLVQHGTLRVGDPMVAGAAWGRVRALIDDNGNHIPVSHHYSPSIVCLEPMGQAPAAFRTS